MKKYLLIFALLLGAVSSWGQTVGNLSATGEGIKWYAESTGGTALLDGTGLEDGETYYASQTVNGVESTDRKEVTATVAPLTASPVVTSPITNGATSVSGTSSEADNTTIEIFVDGSSVGTANVASGAWSKTSLTALTTGQAVTAKATAPGECLSSASNSVTVTTNQTTAPTVVSIANSNRDILVRNNDVAIVTLWLIKDGTYFTPVNNLNPGAEYLISYGVGQGIAAGVKLTAKATATGKTESVSSNELIAP